jgi:aminoglycoside phosphotransferase (APT) family kinase protein
MRLRLLTERYDYRLGNVMFASAGSPGLVAVLDWELAALGDPLADLGYLTAMWAEPTDATRMANEQSREHEIARAVRANPRGRRANGVGVVL